MASRLAALIPGQGAPRDRRQVADRGGQGRGEVLTPAAIGHMHQADERRETPGSRGHRHCGTTPVTADRPPVGSSTLLGFRWPVDRDDEWFYPYSASDITAYVSAALPLYPVGVEVRKVG